MNFNQTWLISRILLVLLGIFACGVWVGRLTSPPQQQVSHQQPAPGAPGRPPLLPGQPVPLRPPGEGGQNSVVHIVKKYRTELSLSDEQSNELLPAFERTHEKLRGVPEPDKRLEIIAALHEELAPKLNEQQLQKAAALLEEARNYRRPKP